MKVGDLMPDFIVWLRSEQLSEKTVGNYASWLHLYAAYCQDEGLEAHDLCVDTTRKYMEYLRVRPNMQYGGELSNATMANHFDFLARFGKYLREKRIITGSLTDGVRRPIPRHKVIHGFSFDQLQAILDAVKEVRSGEQYQDRLSVLIYTLVSTGIRISEALQLRPFSFDFDRRLVKVLGKGDVEREVPFSHDYARVIITYIDKYKIARDGFIFSSRYGRPLNQSTVRDALKRIKRILGTRHGIDRMRVSPHTFRHSFARAWIIKDGNTIALSRILGHSSTQMTNTYARLWGVDVVSAYDACDPTRGLPIPLSSELDKDKNR